MPCNGHPGFGPGTSTLPALRNTKNGGIVTAQSSCVAKVLKGGKKNLRIALFAED
jgi:hypothetical protein